MRKNFINSFSIDAETERIIRRVSLELKCSKSKAVIHIVKQYDKQEKKKK